jgi:transcriptional regulator with XRE-family HTH domain
MNFRENLKAELQYRGRTVMELSALSGVKKTTLDSYLKEKAYSPSAELAVHIARALGVSVEYLVTGEEIKGKNQTSASSPGVRAFLDAVMGLNKKDRDAVIGLSKLLKEHEDAERGKG